MEKTGFKIKDIIKGSGLSLIIALISIIVFGVVMHFSSIGNGVIKPVNQIIKVLSVFLGCVFFVKGEKGFLKGLFVGLIFTLLIHLVFLIFFGYFYFPSFLVDLICGGIIGLISGGICASVKNKN